MRYLFSSVLAVVASIALVAGGFVALSVPVDFTGFGREPEDFYLSVFWGVVVLVLVVYCTYGAIRGFGNRPLNIGKVGWAASACLVALGALMFVEASTDRVLWALGSLVVLAPVAYVGLHWATRGERQSVVPAA